MILRRNHRSVSYALHMTFERLREIFRVLVIAAFTVIPLLFFIGVFHPFFRYIFLFAKSVFGYIFIGAEDGAKYLFGLVVSFLKSL